MASLIASLPRAGIPNEAAPQVWNHWHAKELPAKCHFEETLDELGLGEWEIENLISARSHKHIALRIWCRRNAHRYYVPTILLSAWGIEEWL